MDKIEELRVRLREQMQIYKDSPNITVTYVDLARITENLLELIEIKGNLGFKHE